MDGNDIAFCIFGIVFIFSVVFLILTDLNRKPKQRRCRDCATYHSIRMPYGLCLRTLVPMDASQDPKKFKCCHYVRKWYKLGRSK